MSERLDHELERLRKGEGFCLCGMNAEILPRLASEFEDEPSAKFRAELVEAAWQLRDPDCLPLLERALADPAPVVWKEALDGLVALAGPESIRILESALEGAAGDFREWVLEALEQARESGG